MAKKYIGQATKKHGIAYRKLPYSKKKGSAYHWTYIIRATDKAKRKRIAEGMRRAIGCRKIKYSNDSRYNARLYDDVAKYGFDCAKLKKTSYTNCINLLSVCFRYAGLKTPRKSSARTAPQKWSKVKGIKVYRYKHGKSKLHVGDGLDATQKPKVHAACYVGKKVR